MKTKKRRKLNIKKFAVRVLFLSFIIYAVCILTGQQISMSQREKVVAENEAMIINAKSEQEHLAEELDLVETDEYKELKARELLGYVKADERIYIDVTK